MPRRPTRLLDSINISSAYPKELVANFTNGDLTLIKEDGSHIDIPNRISKADTTGEGNAVTDINVSGHTVTLVKGTTFLTEHPAISTQSDGTDAGEDPGYGGTFDVVSTVTRDANGHVTQLKTKTITMPAAQTIPDIDKGTTTGSGNAVTDINVSGHTVTLVKGTTFLTEHPAITMDTDSTSTGAPAFGGSFTAIDSVTKDTNGHVTKVNTKTITLPSETALSKGTATGEGNAVTDVNLSGHTITLVKGATFLTEHPAITMDTNSTSTSNPGFGGTFTAIDSITKDTNGHVTKVNTKTVTVPSETTLSKGTTTGSGNAVTDVNLSGHMVTLVKGATFATNTEYSASIGTTWSGSGPYTQNITVSGILATDIPVVDVDLSGVTYENTSKVLMAWANIYRITTAANTITIYSSESSTVAIPIKLKVVR